MDNTLIARIKRRIALDAYVVASSAEHDNDYYPPEAYLLDAETASRIPAAIAYADGIGYADDHAAYELVCAHLYYTAEALASGCKFDATRRGDW